MRTNTLLFFCLVVCAIGCDTNRMQRQDLYVQVLKLESAGRPQRYLIDNRLYSRQEAMGLVVKYTCKGDKHKMCIEFVEKLYSEDAMVFVRDVTEVCKKQKCELKIISPRSSWDGGTRIVTSKPV